MNRGELLAATFDAAERYGINPALFAGLIQSESSFNPNAVSSTGASGIAQFTKRTAAAYGLRPQERFNANASLDAASRYVSDLLKKYGGDWRRAISSYKGVSVGGATSADVEKALGYGRTFGERYPRLAELAELSPLSGVHNPNFVSASEGGSDDGGLSAKAAKWASSTGSKIIVWSFLLILFAFSVYQLSRA